MEGAMKLVAIYNVWDDWDMLFWSIENIRPVVDGVIVIYSEKSNYGEVSVRSIEPIGVHLFQREPQFNHPMNSETDKRNYGLQKARELGYTHFITMDADEFYRPHDIIVAKEMFAANPNLNGLVCYSKVYFGSPTLTIGLDTTFVPFIHKLTPDLKHEFNRSYPFAWEGKTIRIDPTRSLNINNGVELVDIIMHHMSWVRKDPEKKIRNSTAKANIEKSTIREDLLLAKDGYYCKFYGKVLQRVQNQFNIPVNGVV